jgi:hypothetical protein
MKKVLCLDFDGVVNSYTSGWQGADIIFDPPVPGAIEFISEAMKHFTVVIHSSRFNSTSRKMVVFSAVDEWLKKNGLNCGIDWYTAWPQDKILYENLILCTVKPPAFVTLDDRAITFMGTFPDPASLLDFKPWNKKDV